MCGWVKLNRDVLEVDLWKEIIQFRLYVLILTQATRQEGRIVHGVSLKRGQYLRAYSKLIEDLGYREGRGEKKYSKSTIKRSIDKLVLKKLITVEDTNMGTLFTLLNYEEIQANGFVDFFSPSISGTITERYKNEDGTNSERYKNDDGTNEELYQEREEKEEKVEKEIDLTDETMPTLPETKHEKADRVAAITECFLQLRNRGGFLSSKDMIAIEKVASLHFSLATLLMWMKEVHSNFRKKSPQASINSMAYYETAIGTLIQKSELTGKIPQKEPLLDRISRLELQGKLG